MPVLKQILLLLVFYLGFFSEVIQASEVRVAVASNFLSTLRVLKDEFRQQTGHKILVSSGSTGKLYAQIRNGAPFDIFLAADGKRPELLEQEGRGVSGSRFTYAEGKIVLWSALSENHGADCKSLLLDNRFKRLAVSNPKTAPYGKAGKEVLQKLELWHALKRKIVRGENASQTLQYVESKNAQLGFVALSQVLDRESGGCLWQIPEDYYSPIEQQAILLKRGQASSAAQQFVKFLKTPEGRAIISAAGYGVQ